MPSFSLPPHPATHYFPTSNVNKNLRRRIYLRLLLLSDSPQVDFYSFSFGLSFFLLRPLLPARRRGAKTASTSSSFSTHASGPKCKHLLLPFPPIRPRFFGPCRPRLRCNSRSAHSRLSFPGGQIDKPREMSRRPMPICPPGSPETTDPLWA